MKLDLSRLKAERVAKNLNQAELAKKIGMSRASYAKRESGIVNIGADELAKIVESLGYSKKDIPIFLLKVFLKKNKIKNKKE